MGNLKFDLSTNDIFFQNLERVLKYILSQETNKSQNLSILKEIGLAHQYTSLITTNSKKEMAYISKAHKTIKNYISPSKRKSYFIKWVNLLFDINEEEYCYNRYYNARIQKLRNNVLTKSFFQENVIKNLIINKANINIFKYGIPKYLREFIWEIIVAEKYANKKYINRNEEQKEYNLFINSIKNNKVNIQIEKDITRTFPEINNLNDNKIQILKKLLIYASSLTKDGYCQGMNFIVGFILRFTNFDEIKSFYFIKYIFPEIKGYFLNGFPLLKKNINIFCKLFSKLYPILNAHFTKNDVFAQFWVGKWFQTLFTLNLPFDELCYIWDLFLIKGFDFAIYISLGIVHYLEKYLLKLEDSSDILMYFMNALNPEKNKAININDIEKYIIPLKKIFLKAFEIEERIKKDKKLNDIVSNYKNEDCESICSQNTKETETSVLNKNFYLHNISSSISTKSINSENNNLRSSLFSSEKKAENKVKIIPNQQKLNYNYNISNNNNLSLINNNNNINFSNSIKSPCIYQRNNKKVYHLFDAIDLTKRNFEESNVNKPFYITLGNYYYNYSNNIPLCSPNCVMINNNILINSGASYPCFVTYFPV